MKDYRTIELWKDVSEEQWNDWKWQVKNRVTTIDQLKKIINLLPEEGKSFHCSSLTSFHNSIVL